LVIRERLIYLDKTDKTEFDAPVRVSRSQVFVELFTRTKMRIFLKKDRGARVDRVVVPTSAISLSA
jgi:hypothetical protein